MFFKIAVETPNLACGVLHTVDLYLITEIYISICPLTLRDSFGF